jgi:peptidoglycan/LPS O-acetylase OafA/YrhL
VLDGLRGLAIFLVFVHNAGGPEGPRSSVAFKLFDVATNVGWVGVQLFFVLSGFLITGILLDTRGAKGAWRSFYMRRVLRIFPLYYAALFVAFVVLPPVIGHRLPVASHATWYVLYLQNWSHALVVQGDNRGFTHFWSLAVEEQFYLVWPIVVLALPRRSFVRVALGLVVLAPLLRVLLLARGASIEWVYQGTFARMDALALGGLAAALVREEQCGTRWLPHLPRFMWTFGTAFLVLVVASRGLARQQALVQTVGYSVIALCFATLVLWVVASAAAGGKLAHALEARWLRVLGKYSYGIYVLHVPLVDALRSKFALDFSTGGELHRALMRLGFTAVCLGLTLVAAMISYHAFEERFLALKRYFVARPA